MKSRFFTLNESDLKFAFAGAAIGLPIGAIFGTANSIITMCDYALNYGVMTSADANSRIAQWALKQDRDAFKLNGQVYYNRKVLFSTNKHFFVPLVLTVATTAVLGIATRRFGLYAKNIINSFQENHSIKNRK